MEPTLLNQDHLGPTWLVAVFVIGLAYLAFVRISFPSYVPLLQDGLLNYRLARQEIRESPILGKKGLVWMIPFAFAMWVLIAWVSIAQFTNIGLDELFLTDIALVLGGTYLIKILTIRLVEGLLGAEYGLEEYVFNVIYFIELSAIIAFPALVLMYFGPDWLVKPLLITVLGIIGIFSLLRWWRGVVGALRNQAPWCYVILYLCALEILPMLVLSKLILNRLHG